ncbi:MAG: hypothetical protein KAX19_05535 [Candidatus Brocadiae bacterium]|nr:hypothetical protein [Candidatus Brocadiia bacterium]
MAEHFAAEIHIGGPIPKPLLDELIATVVAEGASLEGYCEARAAEEPVRKAFHEASVVDLYDEQASAGRFQALEAFLVEHGIHFDRHSDAFCEYEAENAYYRGGDEPVWFYADQVGNPLVRADDVVDVLDDRSTDDPAKMKALRELVSPPEMTPLAPVRLIADKTPPSQEPACQEASSCSRPAPAVVVSIASGVASVIHKPRGVSLAIVDYDVDGADEDAPSVTKDPDGKACRLLAWASSEAVDDCEERPVVEQAVRAAAPTPTR